MEKTKAVGRQWRGIVVAEDPKQPGSWVFGVARVNAEGHWIVEPSTEPPGGKAHITELARLAFLRFTAPGAL